MTQREAHGLRYLALRYFNVAGADPKGRAGQSTPDATHLIKVAMEVALGKRPYLEVYGSDYPTPDGTCLRDYIHVSDLVEAHRAALSYLRNGGQSRVLNCGYGHAHSVLEVIAAVNRVAGKDIQVRMGTRRPGDPAALVANTDRIKSVLEWRPQYDDLDSIVRHALSWEERLPALASVEGRRSSPRGKSRDRRRATLSRNRLPSSSALIEWLGPSCCRAAMFRARA